MRGILSFLLGVLVSVIACTGSINQAAADSIPLRDIPGAAQGPAYVSGAMEGISFVFDKFSAVGIRDISACRQNWPENRIFYDFKDYYQLRANAEVKKRDKNAEWWRWEGLNESAFGKFMEYLEDRCVTHAGSSQPSLAELSAITGHQYAFGMSFENSKLYTEGLRDGLSLAALRAGSESELWPIAECPDKFPENRPYPMLLFWIEDSDPAKWNDPEPTSPPVYGRNVAEMMYEYLVEKCTE